jgi:hypothetical protein
MHRMPTLCFGALFLAATTIRENPREVVEAIPAVVPFHEASQDEFAEGRFRWPLLQGPNRRRRRSIEIRGKHSQGSPPASQLFGDEIVGEA